MLYTEEKGNAHLWFMNRSSQILTGRTKKLLINHVQQGKQQGRALCSTFVISSFCKPLSRGEFYPGMRGRLHGTCVSSFKAWRALWRKQKSMVWKSKRWVTVDATVGDAHRGVSLSGCQVGRRRKVQGGKKRALRKEKNEMQSRKLQCVSSVLIPG